METGTHLEFPDLNHLGLFQQKIEMPEMAFIEGIFTYLLHRKRRTIENEEEKSFYQFCSQVYRYYSKVIVTLPLRKFLISKK